MKSQRNQQRAPAGASPAVLLAALGLLVQSTGALGSADQRACSKEPTDDLIAYGDLITCAINPASDQDDFRFVGAPDEVITIQVTRTAGEGSPCFEVLRPDGTTVSARGCGTSSRRIDASLNQAGQYRVKVSENGANETFSYSLVLDRIAPASPAATALDPGANIDEVIKPLGEMDVYAFRGEIGDKISITGTDTAGSPGALRMELYGPRGNLLSSATAYTQSTVSRTLSEGGAYTFLAYEWGNDEPNFAYSLNYSCTGSCPPMVLKRRYIHTASVEDISGNGAPEVVALVQDNGSGVSSLLVRDSETSKAVKTIRLFGGGVEPLGLAAVGDPTGDGVSEVAVLGLADLGGQLRLWVVDVAEGTVGEPKGVFSSSFAAIGISRVEDMNGDLIPEIGVTALNKSTNAKILKILDGATLDPLTSLVLPN